MGQFEGVPRKASRALHLIGIAFVIIFLRVWYLSVLCREEFVEKAKRPQRREVVERVERASIVDRFGIPLAENRIDYQAAILYGEIQELPAFRWEDHDGKRVKVSLRRRYVEDLSDFLSEKLGMTRLDVEDSIFAKAALFPNTPYILKRGLTEKEYSQLRVMQREWPGLKMQVGSQRVYPQGCVAANILGYVGSIDQEQYRSIAGEIEELKGYIAARESGQVPFLPPGYTTPQQVRMRLHALEEKAYSIHDQVGKTGVEKMFDEELRGFFGKKIFEVDPKGHFIGELPGGRESIAGKKIELTISSELQGFVEQLLREYDEETSAEGDRLAKVPWIKGGAVVVIDPKTGEILALASSPSYDPNDFLQTQQKESSIKRWLEQLDYVGEIWDGHRPLEKTSGKTLSLGWKEYLSIILAPKAKVRKVIERMASVKELLTLQRAARGLLHLSGEERMATVIDAIYDQGGHSRSRVNVPDGEKERVWVKWSENFEAFSAFRSVLDCFFEEISPNNDKLLLLDLATLIVDIEQLSPELIAHLERVQVVDYRTLCCDVLGIERVVKNAIYPLFEEREFLQWREENLKALLAEKRKEEKRAKRYARPYTDYVNEKKQELWKNFWNEHRNLFLDAFISAKAPEEREDLSLYFETLLSACGKEHQAALKRLERFFSGWSHEERLEWLCSVRSFEQRDRPLYGKYHFIRDKNGVQLDKHLAAAFYPKAGFGFTKDITRNELLPQGSVFKLVTAYQGLVTTYDGTPASLCPLEVLDDQGHPRPDHPRKQVLGYTKDGEVIRRFYKGGMLPRARPNIGWTDLKSAIEQTANLYFALLASEVLESPEKLNEAARLFGYGEKTGVELPGEIKGNLPNDINTNKTGLYAYSIGQHTLVVSPLQTASMITAIANGGDVLRPHVIKQVKGFIPKGKEELFDEEKYPYKEQLALLGIDFPLFTGRLRPKEQKIQQSTDPEIVRSLYFPEEIRQTLLDAMSLVVKGDRGSARPGILRMKPPVRTRYRALQNQMVGKTGTAEILHKHTLDSETKAEIRNHVWFAGIGFTEDQTKEQLGFWGEPEIAVVVIHRFSKAGKEGAPFVTEIIDKWRDIRLNKNR